MPQIPFDWNVTTTKWTFGPTSYIVLEKTLDGYSMYGRIDDKPWDNDGEDFFFHDSDELLAFLVFNDLIPLLCYGPEQTTSNDSPTDDTTESL